MDTIDVERAVIEARILREKEAEITEYCQFLLNEYHKINSEINKIMEEEVRPLKSKLSHIKSDLNKIMSDGHIDKIDSKNMSATIKDRMLIKITDKEKALKWAINNPECIKKDILNSVKIKSLINEGVVPDPQKDGIDCNDTYKDISFRKK